MKKKKINIKQKLTTLIKKLEIIMEVTWGIVEVILFLLLFFLRGHTFGASYVHKIIIWQFSIMKYLIIILIIRKKPTSLEGIESCLRLTIFCACKKFVFFSSCCSFSCCCCNCCKLTASSITTSKLLGCLLKLQLLWELLGSVAVAAYPLLGDRLTGGWE